MIVWKPKRVQERLEAVTNSQINLLKLQITKDSELERMLTSPMSMIKQYRFLYSTESLYAGDYSLLQIIEFLLQVEKRRHLYFSKSGQLFTGFIVYEDNGKVIDKIKMASFFDDSRKPNITLAGDLLELILKCANDRERIEWKVDTENTYAMKQYDKVIERKRLDATKNLVDKGRMYLYTVFGKGK